VLLIVTCRLALVLTASAWSYLETRNCKHLSSSVVLNFSSFLLRAVIAACKVTVAVRMTVGEWYFILTSFALLLFSWCRLLASLPAAGQLPPGLVQVCLQVCLFGQLLAPGIIGRVPLGVCFRRSL
jgi:hypothetical protein